MKAPAELLNTSAPREDARRRVLPPIVRIVLTQAARNRRRGAIPEEMFEAQVRRLSREELEPRGLELLVRDLPWGSTRFLVKAKTTGMVCDMIECRSL
jgi:hypothetical protein